MALTKEEKEKRKEQRRVDAWNKTHKTIDGIDHKQCSICEGWLPSTEGYFYKRKDNSIDGLNPYCKPCTSNKSNKYQKENPEQTKAYGRKQYRRKKQYFIENAQRWNKENENKVKILQREWRRSNKDKLTQYRLKREATKTHEISQKEWEECKYYFDYKCAYCGFPETEHKKMYNQQLHKEHVDHEGSNKLDNCVPSCKNCNSSKNVKELNEWYNEDNENFTYERINKIYKWLIEDHKTYIEI